MFNMHDFTKDILNKFDLSINKELEKQLSDLVKNGVLVIEMSHPILVRDFSSDGVRIEQAVKLTCKEMDVIKQLRLENESMRKLIRDLKSTLTGEVL